MKDFPKCGDCIYFDEDDNKCRCVPPQVILSPIAKSAIDPRKLQIQVLSQYPPVKANDKGCGEHMTQEMLDITREHPDSMDNGPFSNN